MTLRKVLLYGGCHALVLRDLLVTYFYDSVEATLLVNFEIIRNGKPFPYAHLREYDVVIFSPIENKGEYNTVHLVEACSEIGVEAICYPWLEWHGYCPGATKGVFKERFQWRYPALLEAASKHRNFRQFAEWAIEAFPENASIDASLATSTAMLRGAEERHEMPVRVSDFIVEHHRRSRLFLVSDHPSLTLYIHVLRQILALIGVAEEGVCDHLERHAEEPQWRWRTPIFPRVAERLALRFSDKSWVDDEVVPGRCLDLHSYLLLYFYNESVILGPVGDGKISPLPTSGPERYVASTTRLVADRLDEDCSGLRRQYRLRGVLSGEAIPLEHDQTFEIDDGRWKSAWG